MPIKGCLNILFSGAFAAVAICMEIFAVLPVLGVVALFVFGMLRMKAAHRLATEKLSESETEENTEAKARLQSDYAYKKRVAIGFAALSFVAMTLLITLLTGVFAYSALVKAYDNATAPSMSFLTLLWKALSDSATVSFQTPYASASASAIVSWLLPLQPATIYSASSGSEYLAWNACINIAACVAAFASFIFVTVKAIMDMVKKKTDKAALRIRRVWILLLSGMALSMLAAALKGNSSVLSGLLFTACYLAFIPAAAMALEGSLQEERKGWIDVALYAVLGLSAIVFCLSVPSMYGAAIPAAAANIFGWTSILNNGYFRV